MLPLKRRLASLAVAALLLVVPSTFAAPQQTPQEVQQVLQRAADYYKNIDAFRFDLLTEIHLEASGMSQDLEITQEFLYKKPNQFSINTNSDMGGGGTLTSNGQEMFAYLPGLGKYSKLQAPESLNALDALFSIPDVTLTASYIMQGQFLPLMLSDNPVQAILQDVTEAQYLGKKTFNGKELEGVRLVRQDLDVDYWFDTGEIAHLRRVVPNLEKAQKAQAQTSPLLKDMKLDSHITIKNWQANPEFKGDAFTFTPSGQDEQVDSLLSAMQSGLAGSIGGSSGHPLEGQPAPDFELALHDGGNFRLSEHKGRPIVLDFWASWCAPCRAGMPILEDTVKQMNQSLAKENQILLLGVNLQEDSETIQKFLNSLDLDIKVVMDKYYSVGEKYHVNGLPQTVLIDGSGKVHRVIVGAAPESMVKNYLNSLTAVQ